MRVTIEDLEALKELSEELEENHIETERSMQDEISTWHPIIRLHIANAVLWRRRERRSAG